MQKRKTFRPWQPEQTTLLPPSPREWLSEDHHVYFLLDLIDELDLWASPDFVDTDQGFTGVSVRAAMNACS
jgi:hypothetical protein